MRVYPYKLFSKLKVVTTMFHVNRYRMLEVRRAMRMERIFRDRTNPLEKYHIVFKEWRDTKTFSNLKSTHCTLLILLNVSC
jgi:hypothetical protein